VAVLFGGRLQVLGHPVVKAGAASPSEPSSSAPSQPAPSPPAQPADTRAEVSSR
jgi:hypothetical protein